MSWLSLGSGEPSARIWCLFGSLMLFLGCAGRPDFHRRSCEVSYDACVDRCEQNCEAERRDAFSKVMVDCARCMGRCTEAAQACEARVDG